MYAVFIGILFLFLGGIGGSFQPARLVLLILPALIPFIGKKNFQGFTPLIKFGIFTYIIWLSYAIVSLIWSPLPIEGLNSEIIVMFIGMTSLVTFPFFTQGEERGVRFIRMAWIFGLICTMPFAIYEILTLNHFAAADEDRVLGGLGVNVPFAAVFFGNYNNFCVYISLCFPFLLWTMIEEKKILKKLFYFILALISILIVVINTSRTGMLVLAIYMVSLLKINWKGIGIAAVCAVFVLFAYRLLPLSIKESMELVFNYRVGVSYDDDQSSQVRAGVYKAGIQFVEQTNGFGLGAGGFEYAMQRSPLYQGIENPHNFFIEIVSQYGIFVFGIFLAWLVKIILTIRRNSNFQSSVKRILYLSIILIPVIGLFNSSALGYTYWWMYLTSMAIIANRQLTAIKE